MKVRAFANVLEAVSGDGQEADAGTSLSNPLVVRALDRAGNAVDSMEIAFSTSDGGSFSPAKVTTGTDGTAQTRWTLGSTGGAQSAMATARKGSASATFGATALSGGPAPSNCLSVEPAADTLNYVGDAGSLAATTSASARSPGPARRPPSQP